MDFLLAFPQLLFAIALVSVLPDDLFGLDDRWSRVDRADRRHRLLRLAVHRADRPRARRCRCASGSSSRPRRASAPARGRILFRELLPNLAAPILVYTTLIIPTNILTEAALSFLGVGIPPPNPSWGGMLSDAVTYYTSDPMYMIIPGGMIFITVLAFNLFGDGLRDALDPKAR